MSTYTTSGITPSYVAGPSTTDQCGGLVGSSSSTEKISYCYSAATVNAQGYATAYAGGLAGTSGVSDDYDTMDHCFATGSVSAQSGYHSTSGGLVGVNSGVINACYAQGDVTASQNSYGSRANSPTLWAGGLAGCNIGTIIYCYASGNVRASQTRATNTLYAQAGGLVGHNYFMLFGSYAVGNVTTSGCGGGLVGGNSKDTYLWECYAVGNIHVEIDSIYMVVGAGRLTGDSLSKGETLAGTYNIHVTNCFTSSAQRITYQRSDYISGSCSAGTILSPNDLRTPGKLTDFDFSDVWTVDDTYNQRYPYLKVMQIEEAPLESAVAAAMPLTGQVRPDLIRLRKAASGDQKCVDVSVHVAADTDRSFALLAVGYTDGRMSKVYQTSGKASGSSVDLLIRNVPKSLFQGEFRLFLLDAGTWTPYIQTVDYILAGGGGE